MWNSTTCSAGANGSLALGCLCLLFSGACNYEADAYSELNSEYEATGDYRSVLDVIGDVDSDGALDFFWGRGDLDWSEKREHQWKASVISGQKGSTLFELSSNTHLLGSHGAGPVNESGGVPFGSFWIGAYRVADGAVDYQLRSGNECKLIRCMATGVGYASRGFGLALGPASLEFWLEDSGDRWELNIAHPSKKVSRMTLELAPNYGKWDVSAHMLRAWRIVSPGALGPGPAMHVTYEDLLPAHAGSILFCPDGGAQVEISALAPPLLKRFRVESSADLDGDGDRDALYLDYSNDVQVLRLVSWPEGEWMDSIPFTEEQFGAVRDYAVGNFIDQPLLVYSVIDSVSNRRSKVTASLLPMLDEVWSVSLDVYGGWQMKLIGDANDDNVSDFIIKGFRSHGWGSALFCLSGRDGAVLWEWDQN